MVNKLFDGVIYYISITVCVFLAVGILELVLLWMNLTRICAWLSYSPCLIDKQSVEAGYHFSV